MTNSADPDQLASSEANWSRSTLFAKTGHVMFSKWRVKGTEYNWNIFCHFYKKTTFTPSCLYSCIPISFWTGVFSKREQILLPCPEVIKLFSCSTQLSMKFVLFINLKILTKFWNFFHAQLSWESSAELSMKKVLNFWYFYFYDQVKFHAQLSWAWKKFYNLGARVDIFQEGSKDNIVRVAH